MIDLGKLEAKLNQVLENETEESFKKWKDEKTRKEIMALLGFGDFEGLNLNPSRIILRCPKINANHIHASLVHTAINFFFYS
jgi:hypothetical protein